MSDLWVSIAIMTVANTFWLFALIWELEQRAKEVDKRYQS